MASLNSINGGSPPLAASNLGAPTNVANGTIVGGDPKNNMELQLRDLVENAIALVRRRWENRIIEDIDEAVEERLVDLLFPPLAGVDTEPERRARWERSREKIRGQLFYAVDPDHPANAAVVDLELAPRGSDGMVRFRGDFLLLKPVDLEKGNGRLLYDVNNRGNLYMLRHINGGGRTNDPSTPEDAGNGFLMREGYSLLWTAWNWDVRSGDHRLQIELPIATNKGVPIRQRIAAERKAATAQLVERLIRALESGPRGEVREHPAAPLGWVLVEMAERE